ATQPIPPSVATELAVWMTGRESGRLLWPGTWVEKAAEMLKRDLAEAGIPYTVESPDGRELFADFHALRHSYVAMLDRAGVSPKMAMQLARHSDPRLTLSVYGKAGLAELGVSVAKLPEISPPAGSHLVAPLVAPDSDSGIPADASRCQSKGE